jgi:CRISPR-associated protein Cas1
MEIKQNTLYITTPHCYISRDHLTLKVEVEKVVRLTVPIHHVESVCIFGPTMVSPQAAQLCWEHGVSVNFFSENGFYLGKWEGVPNTSVILRRAQFRKADDRDECVKIARQIIAGKIQNSRQSMLRSARETDDQDTRSLLQNACDELSKLLGVLRHSTDLDEIRGIEGMAANAYFGVFPCHLRQQREEFLFSTRSRRPPLDRINCLLSFLYALLRHDCIAALAAVGLDPFVGFLHAERPNRPALALDVMEEFRPMIADRLAITLINRKQVTPKDFVIREGGAVEFTDSGRKAVVKSYQERKQDKVTHPVLGQEFPIGRLMLLQSRILARTIRGDIPEYLPCILK